MKSIQTKKSFLFFPSFNCCSCLTSPSSFFSFSHNKANAFKKMNGLLKDSTLAAQTSIPTSNKAWDNAAKLYLVQQFRQFLVDPATGISPYLNEDPKAVLDVHDSHSFLRKYKKNRFRENFKKTAQDFQLEQRQEGRRSRKASGEF